MSTSHSPDGLTDGTDRLLEPAVLLTELIAHVSASLRLAAEAKNWIGGCQRMLDAKHPAAYCSPTWSWNWITRVFHSRAVVNTFCSLSATTEIALGQPRRPTKATEQRYVHTNTPIIKAGWIDDRRQGELSSQMASLPAAHTRHYVYALSLWLGRSPRIKPSHKFQLQSRGRNLWTTAQNKMADLKAQGYVFYTRPNHRTHTASRREERRGGEKAQTHEQLGLAFKTGNWAAINAMQIEPSTADVSAPCPVAAYQTLMFSTFAFLCYYILRSFSFFFANIL